MDKIIKGVLVADVLSLVGVQPHPSALEVGQPGLQGSIMSWGFRLRKNLYLD